MRKIILYFCILFICNACDKSTNSAFPEEHIFKRTKQFKIIRGGCGTIRYVNRIGYDFDSALYMLIKDCPFPVGSYHIQKDTMTIDFHYDDRLFISILYMDTNNYMPLVSLSDVIDTKGNYFRIICKD
jgi:hypothetical protein